MNIKKFLSKKIIQSLKIFKIYKKNLFICQTINDKNGDFQINGVMNISKKNNCCSYKLAKKISTEIKLSRIISLIKVEKQGFINIFLKNEWIEKNIKYCLMSKNIGIKTPKIKKTIIIDYSSPNIAKQMHIGHLRSTVIGDSVAKTLEFLGHNVIRVNHIGDWGSQFGMLIAYIIQKKIKKVENLKLTELETFYQKSKVKFDKEKDFSKYARNCVVKLQSGNKKINKIWKKIVSISIKENQKIYKILNISLKEKDIMGESEYNFMLPEIVSDLKNKKLAIKDNNAIVVYTEKFRNKSGKPIGVIIKKKDGGYLYTTTDIACLKYRFEKYKPDKILYYIDSRQSQHLKQVYEISRKAGYLPKSVSIEHHKIGVILNKKNKKPFQTRYGNTIPLKKVIKKSIKKTLSFIKFKNKNKLIKLKKSNIKKIAIGAIKYYELSKNRLNNYVFDLNQMLSLNGNTAPYVQYAYTRINSIFKKIKSNNFSFLDKFIITNKLERKLALHLLKFEEVIENASNKGFPNYICSYLYQLSKLFFNFYENYKILEKDNKCIRKSRLILCLLIKKTIRSGLNILGIKTVKKM